MWSNAQIFDIEYPQVIQSSIFVVEEISGLFGSIAINFISSQDDEEERVMHSRSDNIKIISSNDANEAVDELFESLRSRYQENLELSMGGSDFTFDSVQHVSEF